MVITIIIGLVIALLGFFLFFSIKYKNVFIMTFVFGKKGSGKTCFLVHEILKYQKKGWTIYTDFDVKIPNIRIIDAKKLGEFVPDSNSLILLDEVGITFNNRNYKAFTDEQVKFWKLQRHYKVRCVMCSQGWDVDLKLRTLTDKMILQSNIGNVISISRPILRGVTLTEPTSEGEARIADTLKFDKIWNWKFYWMPKYFKYFDSFALDPNKKKIPYIISDTKELIDPNVYHFV